MVQKKVLITGACGQVGSELTQELRKQLGGEQVIASDIRELNDPAFKNSGPFIELDVLDLEKLIHIVKSENVTHIYHMAALLSAAAEKNPDKAWDLNMRGLLNVLNTARDYKLAQVYYPSSIAVFGPNTPKQNTPQDTIMDPNTVYGISKLAGEGWCRYYHENYNLDVRGIRYPGLISYKTEPGGGTTDYAIEIFYEALQNNKFECFLKEDTELPMMYMTDAIKATIMLMNAPAEKLSTRAGYNVTSFSFSPALIAAEIKKHLPGFTMNCKPDYRQQIADSWPQSIDDSLAQADWNWKPDYNLEEMVADMLANIKKKLSHQAH
jgi:nucleoside-diphosphate-sugar epimerase